MDAPAFRMLMAEKARGFSTKATIGHVGIFNCATGGDVIIQPRREQLMARATRRLLAWGKLPQTTCISLDYAARICSV
jgi:hypothetical protein